ncbi:dienelactone hydrolase family protein [Ornithinimicrobium sufpigmenti]|uniref:dienelactone hydrolase family protein n=1 Tax=Ornithinimicrobium sufpigmenti TaxID=2508882 RepID=UPI001EE13BB3|nr:MULTISPECIES: dienelactone hydrolase family protein [unclassified Ornithinimicrobium]
MSAMLQHEIQTSKGPLPSLLWLPQGATGRVPGIVVFQEIYGLSSYVRARCADLAQLGYAVLAPQLYARLDPPVAAVQEAGVEPQAVLSEALQLAGQLDWDQAVKDGLSAMTDLGRLGPVKKKKVALLGFCMGGGLAFNVAAAAASAGRPAAALVSYYGSALPRLLDLAPQVECPSLHVFGTDDDYIPMEQVERIREAVTDGGTREQVRFELHPGAGHAFDNPNPTFFHEEASRAAWAQTQEFLAEVLPA